MSLERNLAFLQALSEHNDKSWMDEHRKWYEEEKKSFESFVGAVIAAIAAFDPAIGDLLPKDCIFRINRDIRFSKDKSPYKNNFGASFSDGGKKSPKAGYYIHIQPDQCFLGGGMWMPEAQTLKNIRQEIDYNFEHFQQIINHKEFATYFKKIDGDRLSRPPKGYEETNPAIEFLKHKSFTVGLRLSNKQVQQKDFVEYCGKAFAAMKPFVDFLNQSLD
ncbi:TIGR02453 family protein [Taibaiella sp. KBW10]|uniref:DUF2461 domain-containing protein n=1 Tax=Taibaiella sp. KBW10 TaxID=2153357 RepID=UPI000F5A283F|nr:DUF2461 domain-containing protein [Taibaiella sp. KBW10]RQO31889.1 TIGR02453 family protein [Taibaiella sp. KBW10]